MSLQQLVDSFELNEDGYNWEVSEISEDLINESKVDGKHVIGRAVGPCFIVNGKSANKRFYSKALWESAITKSKGKLDNGLMLGTVGHNQAIDEKAILEGKVSHRVSKLWIDESGKGMGEILILNSPSGQILNSLLKSGAKIPVSSRAFGEYKGKTSEGLDIVNPDTYDLQTFDFVLNPGISTAIPNIVESLSQENLPMDPKAMLESLTQEKLQLNKELKGALETNEALKDKAELLESKLQTVTTALEAFQAAGIAADEVKAIVEQHQALKLEKATLESQVAEYKYLGTPAEIEEAMAKAEAHIEKAGQATAAELEESAAELAKYREYGTFEELDRVMQIAESMHNTFKELGSAEQIAEAFDASEALINNYKELGTPEEIEEALDVLGTYLELGTPAEITEAFDRTLKFVSSIEESKQKADAEALAKQMKAPITVVESLVKTHGVEGAKEIIESLNENVELTARYKAPAPSVNEEVENKGENSLNESADPSTRASRLMSNLSR